MLCCGDPQGERCLCPTPHVVRTAGQANPTPDPASSTWQQMDGEEVDPSVLLHVSMGVVNCCLNPKILSSYFLVWFGAG